MNLDRLLPPLAPVVSFFIRPGQNKRRKLFEQPPTPQGTTIFLGDSITEWSVWNEWFPDLPTVNRGIGGESVGQVMTRLHSALGDAPKLISLLVGTNDLHGLGRSSQPADIAAQFSELVAEIRRRAPAATLLINSVMPRSALFAERIQLLNEYYRRIALEANATYIDLWASMAAADGSMHKALTSDGIHLTTEGYRVWTEQLRPYLYSQP